MTALTITPPTPPVTVAPLDPATEASYELVRWPAGPGVHEVRVQVAVPLALFDAATVSGAVVQGRVLAIEEKTPVLR